MHRMFVLIDTGNVRVVEILFYL